MKLPARMSNDLVIYTSSNYYGKGRVINKNESLLLDIVIKESRMQLCTVSTVASLLTWAARRDEVGDLTLHLKLLFIAMCI